MSNPNPDLEIVIARKSLPVGPGPDRGRGRQGSNLAFFNEIATPACRNTFSVAGTLQDRCSQ